MDPPTFPNVFINFQLNLVAVDFQLAIKLKVVKMELLCFSAIGCNETSPQYINRLQNLEARQIFKSEENNENLQTFSKTI